LYVAAHPAQTQKAAITLSPTLEAARAARRFAKKTTADWGLEELTDAVLQIISELVTNAVEHAGTPMELRLRRRPGALMIEVADGDGRLARPTPTDKTDERHRGLMIVQTLSERWGVRPTGNGKVVWAQMANPYETQTRSQTPRPVAPEDAASAPDQTPDQSQAPDQSSEQTPAIRTRTGRRAAAAVVPHAPAAR